MHLWYNVLANPEKGERHNHKNNHIKTITMTRNGKHAPNKTAIKAYVTKWRKAVIAVTAAVSDMSMTDLLWSGVEAIAKTRGVLDKDGKVTKEYENRVAIAEAMIEQTGVDK